MTKPARTRLITVAFLGLVGALLLRDKPVGNSTTVVRRVVSVRPATAKPTLATRSTACLTPPVTGMSKPIFPATRAQRGGYPASMRRCMWKRRFLTGRRWIEEAELPPDQVSSWNHEYMASRLERSRPGGKLALGGNPANRAPHRFHCFHAVRHAQFPPERLLDEHIERCSCLKGSFLRRLIQILRQIDRHLHGPAHSRKARAR